MYHFIILVPRVTMKTNKIHCHRFPVLGKQKKDWLIKIQQDKEPQYTVREQNQLRKRQPPFQSCDLLHWSMHNPVLLLISGPAITYHIKNGPFTGVSSVNSSAVGADVTPVMCSLWTVTALQHGAAPV